MIWVFVVAGMLAAISVAFRFETDVDSLVSLDSAALVTLVACVEGD